MISSESNTQIKEIAKLQKNARERRKKGLFVVEGIKLVMEAAKHGRLQQIYVSETAMEGLSEEAGKLVWQYPMEIVTDAVLKSVSETVTPQGILGLVRIPSYDLEEMIKDEKRAFLLLDNLRDPGNLGTILRTAEGADMSGVILSRECVDLFNPKVVRSTMGAVFRVPFYYTEDLTDVIDILKHRKIPVYGAMLQGSVVYDEVDYRPGAAIVIGNEAKGISDAVAGQLSAKVRIPMAGSLESLNAAVSAAILMYEVARQKRE